MMVNGSPSLRDSSACSPTGKLPKATALALLLSGWRDRDGHPLARHELQWRLGSHHQSSHGHPRAACLLGSRDGNLESDAFPQGSAEPWGCPDISWGSLGERIGVARGVGLLATIPFLYRSSQEILIKEFSKLKADSSKQVSAWISELSF